MANQTAFQYELLAVLDECGGIHGLGAKERLEGDVNHPTLYMNLDQLVDTGLVKKTKVDGRTNEYTLTHEGREELQRRIGVLTGEDQ